jgi:hypothetical protein
MDFYLLGKCCGGFRPRRSNTSPQDPSTVNNFTHAKNNIEDGYAFQADEGWSRSSVPGLIQDWHQCSSGQRRFLYRI